ARSFANNFRSYKYCGSKRRSEIGADSVNLLAHSRSFSGVMSRGLKITPSINCLLNPSTVLNPSLKPCCANSFTSRSQTVPLRSRSSLHPSPLFPRSSGETHSPFRLILERCLREILAHDILDDIRLGDREADRRIG